MVIEPFTKSKRPQTATDDETWVANQPNPTLNAFDQGDTRTTTAIVFENSYRDAARIAEDGITQTLTSKMGTGGGNTPMVAQSVNYSFDTQFGSNAEVYEDKAPPLKASQQSPSIAFATNQRAEVRELDDKAVALSAEPGTNQQTYVAFPIQDGREMEKNQNGIGVADDGTPAYTIDQTGAQAIAYGLQGNMIGRQDHNGPQGAGISHPDDPMFSLTSTDRHAVVQYDGYNQRLYEDDVSVTIRIGRDSSDFIAQPIEAAGFKAGQGAGAGGIGYQEGTSQTLTSQMNGIEPTVLTPTMAVRRLTPLECERLMGWPDNWTATKADGTPQSDTHRYKQCGNGVASPVAQWIGEILIATDTATATDAGATD
jgi:DNA (cytosine-5)-methyltransferase 1